MSQNCPLCKGQAYLILSKEDGDEATDTIRFRFCDCSLGQEMQEQFIMGKVGLDLGRGTMWLKEIIQRGGLF